MLAGSAPLEAVRESPLQAAGLCVSLGLLTSPLSACPCRFLNLLNKETGATGGGATLPPYDLTLTRYVLSILISKSPSEVLGVRMSTDEFFGGWNSTRNIQGGGFFGALSVPVRYPRLRHTGFLPEPSRC